MNPVNPSGGGSSGGDLSRGDSNGVFSSSNKDDQSSFDDELAAYAYSLSAEGNGISPMPIMTNTTPPDLCVSSCSGSNMSAAAAAAAAASSAPTRMGAPQSNVATAITPLSHMRPSHANVQPRTSPHAMSPVSHHNGARSPNDDLHHPPLPAIGNDDMQPLPALPYDMQYDVEHKLGRANGKIFIRQPGLEGKHDGQIMVRLKKKRFIIIDYTTGKRACATNGCNKNAIPTLLYDSDPTQQTSLYLRSGLCFTCQRRVNEKRRSPRKSTSNGNNTDHMSVVSSMSITSSPPFFSSSKKVLPSTLVAIPQGLEIPENAMLSPCWKRMRGTPPAAAAAAATGTHYLSPPIVIDGSVDGARPASVNYDHTCIAQDLQATSNSLSCSSNELVNISSNVSHHCSTDEVQAVYEKAMRMAQKAVYQLSQWKVSWDSHNSGGRNLHHQQVTPSGAHMGMNNNGNNANGASYRGRPPPKSNQSQQHHHHQQFY